MHIKKKYVVIAIIILIPLLYFSYPMFDHMMRMSKAKGFLKDYYTVQDAKDNIYTKSMAAINTSVMDETGAVAAIPASVYFEKAEVDEVIKTEYGDIMTADLYKTFIANRLITEVDEAAFIANATTSCKSLVIVSNAATKYIGNDYAFSALIIVTKSDGTTQEVTINGVVEMTRKYGSLQMRKCSFDKFAIV